MQTTCPARCGIATPPTGGTETLAGFFGRLLDTADFPARWNCGRWTAGLGWLHIGADLAIAAAYLSIPLALAYFLARRRSVPYPGLLVLFGAFILSCGLGHVVEALIFWHPAYRLAGLIKAVTAVVSWATVVAIVRVLPAALRLPDLARSEAALRATEERFALAVQGTDHGIWDWDVATGSLYYNPQLRELLGIGADEASGTLPGWEALLHPEDRGRTMAAIAAHFEHRETFDVEYRLRTRDRGYLWFHARGRAVWDAAGRPTRMAGSITDVTGRKQQEAVIAEQVRLSGFGRDVALALTEAATLEEMLGRCAEVTVRDLDAAFARIWTLDEAGEVLELRASAGMYTHLDGPHARVPVGHAKIGRIARDRRPHLTNAVLGDPGVPDQEWAAREGLVAFAGYPLLVEGRLVGVWALFARQPITGAALAAMESVASGIALGIERKRAAEALRRSEAQARRLALVASRTDNAVIITDAAGRIEWVNDGFTRLTEYGPAEVLGRKPGHFLQGPETDPATARRMRERLAAGEGFAAEIVNYSKSGRRYWLAIDARPIRDEAGVLTNFIAIESDITERKRGEQALRRAHDDLRHANAELEGRVRERTAELEAQAEALRRAEEDYRGLFENAAEGIFQTTAEGRYLRANPALARIYGYATPAELAAELFDIGRQLYVEPGRREEFRRLVHEHGAVAGFESRVRRKDGGIIWIRENARAVPGPDGTVWRYEGIVEDITERKRAEAEIRDLNAHLGSRLERIAALRRIDLAIAAGPDLEATLGVVLDQVRGQLGVAAAAVRLLGPGGGPGPLVVARGIGPGDLAAVPLTPGEGAAGAAILHGRTTRVDDLAWAEEPLARAIRRAGGRLAAYRAVPLVAKGEARGVLEVFHPAAMPEDPDWCGYLETLAGQAAIAVDNVALFEGLQRSNAELERAYDATIEGWSKALDLRDKETEGHTRRVTEMALRLARALGLGEAELVHVRRGALLHDIGKLGVPDAVLLKPGALSEAEWAVMRRHPVYAHEWLSPIAFLRPALEIPYGHHERWDGAGYPLGLKAEAIPLAARLFAAVDIWDALRSDRPYRAAWPEDRVREHLRSLAGNHLDPAVVAALLGVLDGAAAPAAARIEPAGLAPESAPPEGGLGAAIARVRELERVNSRLVELAATDELTGLRNRRHFREALAAATATAVRRGGALSLMILDLDGFKAYNDAHGHPAGDEVLAAVGGIIRAHVRPGDVAARHGGEEFAVLMPATDAEGARACAERLRGAIAGRFWPLRAVTASFGVATRTADPGEDRDLVALADRALYHAKRLGRDRVAHDADLPAAPAGRAAVLV